MCALQTFRADLYTGMHTKTFCQKGRKEGNVLFNNTLNTFYLQLYGVKHMVKDHSDSERGNLLLPHGLPINSNGYFICTSQRQDSIYHSLCYTSCRALAATRNRSNGTPGRIDLTTNCTMSKYSTIELHFTHVFVKTILANNF